MLSQIPGDKGLETLTPSMPHTEHTSYQTNNADGYSFLPSPLCRKQNCHNQHPWKIAPEISSDRLLKTHHLYQHCQCLHRVTEALQTSHQSTWSAEHCMIHTETDEIRKKVLKHILLNYFTPALLLAATAECYWLYTQQASITLSLRTP